MFHFAVLVEVFPFCDEALIRTVDERRMINVSKENWQQNIYL